LNGDGVSNISDLLLLQRAVAGQIGLNDSQVQQADVHPSGGDGVLDISDLLKLEARISAP